MIIPRYPAIFLISLNMLFLIAFVTTGIWTQQRPDTEQLEDGILKTFELDATSFDVLPLQHNFKKATRFLAIECQIKKKQRDLILALVQGGSILTIINMYILAGAFPCFRKKADPVDIPNRR